ncbi:MAG: hypothetical protein NTW14_05790 [bacterium]|nr:hypothetical protein [bacterium]
MSKLTICVTNQDFPAKIPQTFFLSDASPVVLCGAEDLLQLRKVCLLNSRQSPQLTSRRSWIDGTLTALRHLDPNKTAIISSVGTTPWDFLSWAAAKSGLPVILIFPAGSAQNFNISRTKAIVDLGLDADKTLALKPLRLGPKSVAESSLARDRWVLALSDLIYPISVRPKGNLVHYLEHPNLSESCISNVFATAYEDAPNIKRLARFHRVALPEWFEAEDYHYHWTRSCVGPWPDETHAEYFDRLTKANFLDEGGLSTLRRILEEGVIRSSGRMIRGKYPVVPFTERSPLDLPELLKWRAGLRHWTFEPYGIGIRKAAALKIGARPVIYAGISDFERMSDAEKPFFQLASSGKIDWRMEKEWRICADVILSDLSAQDAVVLVYNQDAARRVQSASQYEVIPLLED